MPSVGQNKRGQGKIKEVVNGKGQIRYHVRIRLKGAPLQCGVFANKTLAKEFIQRTEASIKEGRYFKDIEAKKHTLADLINRYVEEVLPKKPKSYKKQFSQLMWWKDCLGHAILADLVRSPALIIEQRDKLAREITRVGVKRSPSTVVRYLAALSHAFSIAMREWTWVDDNPLRRVSKPKEPRGRTRFLSSEERTALLEACKILSSTFPHIYEVVVLGMSTGMRFSEIMRLTWKDVDFERCRILLRETKNGEERSVVLVEHAHKTLLGLSRKRRLDTFLLFPSKQDPSRPADIRNAWEKALEMSGIEDFRFHDLRHSFASEMAMSGATDTDLRILLGHKSASMVARYSHLTERHQMQKVREMNAKIFSVETDEVKEEAP